MPHGLSTWVLQGKKWYTLNTVGVKYNEKGQCITIAHSDTNAEKLAEHAGKFVVVKAINIKDICA